jgi:V8-like Glu-specific endopeptidase
VFINLIEHTPLWKRTSIARFEFFSTEVSKMANIEQAFARQIAATEARYHESKLDKKTLNQNLGPEGDWRELETPQRVLKRMVRLGLSELAGSILGKEAVTEGVESAVQADKKVGLLERIIQENDLLSARFLRFGWEAARATGRILIRERGRTVGYGTGFLVSPRLLMTNNHVLEDRSIAAESVVEFDFYERQNGATGPTVMFALEPHHFFQTDERLDFTLVRVSEKSTTGQSITERGFIPLIAESGKALVGEPVNIVQHPNGEPQQIAIKNNKITRRMNYFLHYEADTEPGSSGSPVFNMQWELAALHHSGVPRRDEQNRILLRNNRPWDGSRSTMDQIDWIANEGVRISSILHFLRQELEERGGPEWELFEEVLAGDGPPHAVSPKKGALPKKVATASDQIPQRIPQSKRIWENEDIDKLAPGEISKIVSDLEVQSLEVTFEEATPGEVLVAEGDSWFDYSLAGLDIIDCLKKFHGYKIYNVAQAGDTLDNMAWGSEYDRRWRQTRPPLEETLQAVQKYRPRVVLLSGGGNDIAGIELLAYLNHKSSGLESIRQSYTKFAINEYFSKAFHKIIQSIWAVDNTIHIIVHGYGYPVPDGRGVINFLGFSFLGPWLRPSLCAKGYFDRREQEHIIRELIDMFNEMLENLVLWDHQKRIHYINLRPIINRDDWENELHLRNSAYKRVSNEFNAVIHSIMET